MAWCEFFINSSDINDAFIGTFPSKNDGIDLFPVGLFIGDIPLYKFMGLYDFLPPDYVILGFKLIKGFSISVFLKPKLFCWEVCYFLGKWCGAY